MTGKSIALFVKKCYLCSAMTDYVNILALLIGISTAFFAIFAIYILFLRKDRTRFQTVLGWIMVIWALSNLKNIILTFPGMYTASTGLDYGD